MDNIIEYLKNCSVEEKYKLLYQAYKEICKMLREHPVDIEWYLEDDHRFAILLGGNDRDPQGMEWGMYFMEQVIAKEIENGKKND